MLSVYKNPCGEIPEFIREGRKEGIVSI